MKVQILYGYRGRLTHEAYWPAGIREVEDGIGQYLIENGHASKVLMTVDMAQEGAERTVMTIVTAPGGPVTVPLDLGADGDRDAEDAAADSEDETPETNASVADAPLPTEGVYKDLNKDKLVALAAEHGLILNKEESRAVLIAALIANRIRP